MTLSVVIPVFNHGAYITPAVEEISDMGFSCILVDDGSADDTWSILEGLSQRFPNVTLLCHHENRGKGAAVLTGIMEASRQGYDSIIQIDADGQHQIEDLPRFATAAREHPSHLVLGRPRFDESVPRIRYYGRYLTHGLVWLECLSLKIQDSMCGFRVYPIAPVLDLHHQGKIPFRMDFDTEVAVRLFWMGIPVINLDTPVCYPENGWSNFRMFKDNVRLTCMHIRLILGMLLRLPILLFSKRSPRRG